MNFFLIHYKQKKDFLQNNFNLILQELKRYTCIERPERNVLSSFEQIIIIHKEFEK